MPALRVQIPQVPIDGCDRHLRPWQLALSRDAWTTLHGVQVDEESLQAAEAFLKTCVSIDYHTNGSRQSRDTFLSDLLGEALESEVAVSEAKLYTEGPLPTASHSLQRTNTRLSECAHASESNDRLGDICITAPRNNAEAVAAARVLSRLLSEQLVINKVCDTLDEAVRGDVDPRPRLVILAKGCLSDPAVAASITSGYRSKKPVLGVLAEGLGFRFIGHADLFKTIAGKMHGRPLSGAGADSLSVETLAEVTTTLPGVTVEEFGKAIYACFSAIALPLSCGSGSKQLLQSQVSEIHARLRSIASSLQDTKHQTSQNFAELWTKAVSRHDTLSPKSPGTEGIVGVQAFEPPSFSV